MPMCEPHMIFAGGLNQVCTWFEVVYEMPPQPAPATASIDYHVGRCHAAPNKIKTPSQSYAKVPVCTRSAVTIGSSIFGACGCSRHNPVVPSRNRCFRS